MCCSSRHGFVKNQELKDQLGRVGEAISLEESDLLRQQLAPVNEENREHEKQVRTIGFYVKNPRENDKQP